ncbi:MAG: diguanylate cyclase [Deltaproteobacteria bacterium]|nr:diguanylate cyclase [Deltaproteobacteria bacterium]
METKKNTKKILIVDDDALIVKMLTDILVSKGFDVRSISGGKNAVAEVKTWLPDLILLDLIMDDMDGVEVCKAIRALDISKRPSIVIISIKDEKKIIADALTIGADDFIVKPIDELELIARINAQLRISQFYSEIDEDKKNLEHILDITTALSATLDTEEVLSTMVQKVAEVTGAVRSSIVLIGRDNDGYVLVSNDNSDVKNLRIDLNKYPEIKKVLEMKAPLSVENMTNNPIMGDVKDFITELEGMCVLVVPIVFNEEVLGTLFLRTARSGRGFNEKELNFCKIVANASYHAIKNAKLYEEIRDEKETLREMAITDQLTGLYNHNYFYKRLEEEFERAVRYDTELTVLMMDIDDFKRINDNYGHRAGDKSLNEVATMIKKGVRKIDFVARYGGEEFAVILPHTPLKGALLEAERLRKLVSDHSYAGLLKEKITISIGLASYPMTGIMNSGDFVNEADNALYEAKQSGKNCIRMAND